MKTDLSVDFAGLELKNPIMIACSPLTLKAEGIRRCAKAGVAAVVTKTVMPKDMELAPHPIALVTGSIDGIKCNLTNYDMSSRKCDSHYAEELRTLRKECGVPIIFHVVCFEDPEVAVEIAKFGQDAGVDMIELNAPYHYVKYDEPKIVEIVEGNVKAVKKAVDIPVMQKISANTSSLIIPGICKAAENAGADALSATDGFPAISEVDIEKACPPLRSWGDLSGPGLKPIGLRIVADAAKTVKIPISGIGGITTAKDVLEYMTLGARTVQMCTAILWNGPGIIRRILADLEKWLNAHEYSSVRDVVGLALKNYSKNAMEVERKHFLANVDETLCTACGACFRSCPFLAITIDGFASVNPEKCEGCGLCVQLCPEKAILLAEK